jgi:hypothetical protein
MKVSTVRDTLPYGHAPTYQISLTYLERQKCVIFFYFIKICSACWSSCSLGMILSVRANYVINNYVSPSNEGKHIVLVWFFLLLWSCTHIPNIIDLSGKTKKLWSAQASLRKAEEAEAEEKIRLKQYVFLRSKGNIWYVGAWP